MNYPKCPFCSSSNIVEVYSQGESVCRGCGSVITSNNFYEDSKYDYHCMESHESLPPEAYDNTIKRISNDNQDKLSQYIVFLSLPEVIEQEAKSMLQQIYAKRTYKGIRTDAVVACAIYLASNKQKEYTTRRTAREICDGLGIDFKVFTKALRDILSEQPLQNQVNINTNKMDDTLTRQIRETLQNFDSDISNVDVMKLAKVVKALDEERKSHQLLLGSPPYVVNSILIYLACDKKDQNITLPDKTVYAKRARLSRGTLDKHLSLLKKAKIGKK